MSKINQGIFTLLVCVLVAALAVPAAAAGDRPVFNADDVRVPTMRHSMPIDPVAAAEAKSERRQTLLDLGQNFGTAQVAAPNILKSNQCSVLEENIYWDYTAGSNDPFSCGSFERPYTKLLNNSFLPESLKTVYWFVVWSPDNGYGAGEPEITVHITGSTGGHPDTTNILASITRPFADWTTDPNVDTVFQADDFGGFVSFDFSSFDILLPALNTTQLFAVLEITNRYEIIAAGSGDPANVNTVAVFTDNAGEGACTDGAPASCGIFRNRANYQEQLDSCGAGGQQLVWVNWVDLYGAPYDESWAMLYEVAVADPDCQVIADNCFDPLNFDTYGACFAMPSCCSPRKAGFEQISGPVAGSPCTVKTVSAFICDWTTTVYDDSTGEITDVGTAVDVDAVIFGDGGGEPGAEIARLTLDGATIENNWLNFQWNVWDFSSLDIVIPPGATYYVQIELPGAPVQGTPGFTLAGDIGGFDPACGAPESFGGLMFVDDGTGDTTWSDLNTFYGYPIGWAINTEVCCVPSSFLECVPAADADWETQGNGFARTNASTASISNLCALQTAWSAEPGGTVLAIQPIIAGDYVLVSATDSLHCYDKLSGVQLWAFGGFPYIVGDLRGAPTVDLANDAVYVGGAGAQAFSRVELSTGAKVWSRSLGGAPDVPLNPGQTNWTPSVLAGGNVYFTQETGWVYCLDAATGVDVVGPVQLPDAPGSVPYNGLTSDGVKLWIGTGDAVGTDGNIHQLDAATLAIDWTLNAPGNKFYPGGVGDPDFDPFSPEGFPGAMAYEDGILYYHSLVRNDGNGFLHFPGTGAVGAIDVAAELGGGEGILWVNDANNVTVASPGLTPSGTYLMSGPAVGPQMIYLTGRGFFGGVTEQDGVSAWDKLLGVRLWYAGYTGLGVSGGVGVLDDVRSCAPATVICQPDGVPYVFTGHVGGTWRLYNGNTGELQWYRTMTGRTRGTAVGDDCVATTVWNGGPAGGGAVVVFTVQQDRPRLQIDSQYVFRTATPGDGVASDIVTDAFQNAGCIDLSVVYGVVAPPDPVRVTNVNPNLASATERATRNLGGYDAMLDAYSLKSRQIMRSAGIDDDESGESNVRTFASNLGSTADPLFVTAVTGPASVGAGATATIDVTYDETGLTNNTGYTNFIELETNDPDYYPQDPTGADLGLPSIQFELFIGCPDAQDFMNLGNAGDYSWITNFGAEGGGDNFSAAQHDGIVVNGNEANHFDGGWALVVTDSVHWAFDGCSSGGYPRRAGEWGPTLPCGLTINALQAPNPMGGLDDYEEVSYNMIDLASTNGFFAPSSRQCGGWLFNVQRVSSQDPEFGMFLLTKFTMTNEAGDFGDLTGDISDVYFGGVTDWDISSNDVLTAYADGYAQEDGGAGGSGNGTWLTGHVRLDGDIVGAGPLGSGGAPTFMSSDIQDDQGRGNRAFDMLSDPANYGASVDPASTFNTDLAALMSLAYYPTIADGASETFYFGIYMVENGVQATWSDAAGADAAYADVACRMKGFAGFGKGDVNCDGVVDLADVVALGNILDGIITPAGGGIYTADVDGNNAYEQADYDLLYDVVAGVQPASAMANAWRF